MKQCSKCQQKKNRNDFHKSANKRDGLRSECKLCRIEWMKQKRATLAWSSTNIGLKLHNSSFRHLKSTGYSGSYEQMILEYERLFSEQNGKCRVCDRDNVKLQLDHSHVSGKIRGLLCRRCNRVAGFLNDNPQLVSALAEYLKNVEVA